MVEGAEMKTDVDTALKEIADWYIKNKREMTQPELADILVKHCEDETEIRKFTAFLETEPGQMRFKTLLRERKEETGYPKAERKFPLGQIVMTRGVSDLAAENTEFAEFATASLQRHTSGDWGDMSQEDKDANDEAVKLGNLRIFSAYQKGRLRKIWIITEADRSATTILFPEEY